MAERSSNKPHVIPDAPYIRRVIIAVLISLLGLALALFLWHAVRVLLIGFAGVLLAVLLRSIAEGITRVTRLPNGWALALTLLLLIVLLVGLCLSLAPGVIEQGNEMAKKLPEAAQSLKHRIEQTGWGKQIVQLVDGAKQSAPTTQAAAKATGVLKSTFAVVLDLVVILFLGIFLAAQPRLYVDGLSFLFPPAMRPRICQVLQRCGYTLRWWLIAQAIDMVVIGVLTAVGLYFLKVPLALALGVIAALFNFIPNFGPLFSYIPAVLLAMVISPEKALYVTLLYIVLQSIEGYVLLPLLQRGAVDTAPALLIASQVLLTLLVGGLGLALAAPLTACAVVAIKMLYLHDILGDPVELPGKKEPRNPSGPAL